MRRADRYGLAPSWCEVALAAVMARVRRIGAEINRHDAAERFRDMGVDVFLGALADVIHPYPTVSEAGRPIPSDAARVTGQMESALACRVYLACSMAPASRRPTGLLPSMSYRQGPSVNHV